MQTELVLDVFEKKKKGVTLYDFPIGSHFKEEIRKLRARGHIIDMFMAQDMKKPYRNIGHYSYRGKQDKPYIVNADYQLETLERLPKAKEFNSFRKLLEKAHCNKSVLDFINREVTNYHLKR